MRLPRREEAVNERVTARPQEAGASRDNQTLPVEPQETRASRDNQTLPVEPQETGIQRGMRSRRGEPLKAASDRVVSEADRVTRSPSLQRGREPIPVNGSRKLTSCRLWPQAIIATVAAQKTS
jgi:hypothetical protein